MGSLEKIWENWIIRGAVIFSLTMQIILIWLAPLRKKSSSRIITIFIWSAYLLAESIAVSSVGLIINTQRYKHGDDHIQSLIEDSFMDLWVPFLLLHLGGPDTITAFALEDNELWVRDLLSLITQGLVIGFLLLYTFSSNKLRVPTTFMWIAGIIKYSERTCSLYLASKDTFRSSMVRKPKAWGVNLAKLGVRIDPKPNTRKTEEAKSNEAEREKGSNIIQCEPEKKESESLNDMEVIVRAHEYFNIFKGLIVDLIFSFKERDESRKFFVAITPRNAFNVIEAELHFMYEVLYTKAAVVHSNWGTFFRLVARILVIASLVMFHFFIKKHGFDKDDIGVTYALLLGAIGLDALALLMSTFSNWTMVIVFNLSSREDDKSFVSKFCTVVLPVYRYLLDLKKAWLFVCETDNHTTLRTPIMFRKWSECVPCFNLVTYCLNGYPVRIHGRMSADSTIMSCIHGEIGKLSCVINEVWKMSMSFCKSILFLSSLSKRVKYFLHIDVAVKYWITLKQNFVKLFGLEEFFDELTYVSKEPLTMELWRFIFEELKEKSLLINNNQETPKKYFSARGDVALKKKGVDHQDTTNLTNYLKKVSYDESLLLWHIATELLYNGETRTDDDGNKDSDEAREFSKILADYMLYILILRPTMMSAIAGIAKLRYDDTCADAKRFFRRKGLRPQKVKTACKMVLDINTDFQTTDFVMENESLSVLFKACMLAKELRKLKEKKWKIMSQVWVELLSYGASHCGATSHAQQLSRGGDLITFVWLLMGHFGLLDHFQPNSTLL